MSASIRTCCRHGVAFNLLRPGVSDTKQTGQAPKAKWRATLDIKHCSAIVAVIDQRRCVCTSPGHSLRHITNQPIRQVEPMQSGREPRSVCQTNASRTDTRGSKRYPCRSLPMLVGCIPAAAHKHRN